MLRNLPTLFLDPGQQALDLPVGGAQAAGVNQVLQGSVELSGEREDDTISEDQTEIDTFKCFFSVPSTNRNTEVPEAGVLYVGYELSFLC